MSKSFFESMMNENLTINQKMDNITPSEWQPMIKKIIQKALQENQESINKHSIRQTLESHFKCDLSSQKSEIHKYIIQSAQDQIKENDKSKMNPFKEAKKAGRKRKITKSNSQDEEEYFFKIIKNSEEEEYFTPNILSVAKKSKTKKKERSLYALSLATLDIYPLSPTEKKEALKRGMIYQSSPFDFPNQFYLSNNIFFNLKTTTQVQRNDLLRRRKANDASVSEEILKVMVPLTITAIRWICYDKSLEEWTPVIDANVLGKSVSEDAEKNTLSFEQTILAAVKEIYSVSNFAYEKMTIAKAKTNFVMEISGTGKTRTNLYLKDWCPKWFNTKEWKIYKDSVIDYDIKGKEDAQKLRKKIEEMMKVGQKDDSSDSSSDSDESSDNNNNYTVF